MGLGRGSYDPWEGQLSSFGREAHYLEGHVCTFGKTATGLRKGSYGPLELQLWALGRTAISLGKVSYGPLEGKLNLLMIFGTEPAYL